MEYKQILQASTNKLNDREASKIFDKLLNKTDVKRESNKAEVQHIVLAYIFSNGLLENGYMMDLTVDSISKELEISKGPVNTVLGTFGYKYERDRVTPKLDKGSQGLVDRYFKFDYVEDKTGALVKKYSKSVFTLVVNEKLYDKLDELGVTGYNRLSSQELEELHTKIKEGSYTRKTVIEQPEDMPVVFKQTKTTYNEESSDVEVSYHGLEEMVEWANKKLQEQEVEEAEEVVEQAEEDYEVVFDVQEEEEEEVVEEVEDYEPASFSFSLSRKPAVPSVRRFKRVQLKGESRNVVEEPVFEEETVEEITVEEPVVEEVVEEVEEQPIETKVATLLNTLKGFQGRCKAFTLSMRINQIEKMLASEYADLTYVCDILERSVDSYSKDLAM